MRNSQSSNIYYQNKKNQKFSIGNKEIKTTNVNILLNRVRQEKKIQSKNKIFLSLTIIGILFFTSIIVFTY